MSKAKEYANKVLPVIPEDEYKPLWTRALARDNIKRAYHQAEKDLALSWEDVEWLLSQIKHMSGLWVKTNPDCEKVLNRFNELKRK